MSFRIGITGGIGSGKSMVSRLLRLLGCPVYDTDREARRLMDSDPDILAALVRMAGEGVVRDHHLDRGALAEWMFSSQQHTLMVNALVHPAVGRDFDAWCKRREDEPLVFVESAILFESGFDSHVDRSVSVTAPLDVRLERAMRRDGATREQVMGRMRRQMSEDERNRMSDHVLVNDGSTSLVASVTALYERLLQEASSAPEAV